MILAIGNDGQFAEFWQAPGRPEWTADERWSVAAGAHTGAHDEGMHRAARSRDALRTDQHRCLRARPRVRSRGDRITMTHQVAGETPLVASPIRLSSTPVQYRAACPMLGQHTGVRSWPTTRQSDP